MDRRALLGLAALGAAATASKPAQASGGGGSASASSYIQIPTLTATIVRPDGRRGVLSIETGLDVPDAALRTRATQSMPRVRAAFNSVAQRAGQGLSPSSVPDIDRLGRELQTACDTALGRRGARVLLATVMAL